MTSIPAPPGPHRAYARTVRPPRRDDESRYGLNMAERLAAAAAAVAFVALIVVLARW